MRRYVFEINAYKRKSSYYLDFGLDNMRKKPTVEFSYYLAEKLHTGYLISLDMFWLSIQGFQWIIDAVHRKKNPVCCHIDTFLLV